MCKMCYKRVLQITIKQVFNLSWTTNKITFIVKMYLFVAWHVMLTAGVIKRASEKEGHFVYFCNRCNAFFFFSVKKMELETTLNLDMNQHILYWFLETEYFYFDHRRIYLETYWKIRKLFFKNNLCFTTKKWRKIIKFEDTIY